MKIFSPIIDLFSPDLSTEEKRIKFLNRSDSLFPKSLVAKALLIAFVLCDFFCLYTLLDSVFTQIEAFSIMLGLTLALVLDTPMSIAGTKLKKYIQGLTDKKDMLMTVSPAVSAFALVYIIFVVFRMSSDAGITVSGSVSGNMRDAVANMMNQTSANKTSDSSIITAKLLHAITPLGTSLASFAVGFASSDPLKDQIKAAQQVRSYIKEVIITKKAAISEREDMAKESRDFMLALEDDLYHSFTKKIKSEIIVIKQYAYNMLMRKLKDPNSLTAITKKAEATNQDFDDSKPSDHAYRLLKGEADAEPTDESDNQ